jgi:hypothetical protein
MAEENGKPKDEADEREASDDEFVPTMALLEQDFLAMGPWTDEDERCFQRMRKALEEADRGY